MLSGPPMSIPKPRTVVALVTGALLFFIVGSVLLDFSVPPTRDEGWMADPGYQLFATGRLRSLVLNPTGCEGAGCVTPRAKPAQLRGWSLHTDRHVYWCMPMYLMLEAGWSHLVGFGLVQLRLLSGVWGLLLLGAWYLVLRTLLENRHLALLATSLLACDTVLIQYSSVGRMDVMCCALGITSWAAYLRLRRRNLSLAVCSAVALLVAAFLTHPNAIFGICGFLVLFAYFDRRQVSFRLIGWALVPVVVGLAGWLWYIFKDPHLFLLQFLSNAAGRSGGFLAPLQSIRNEVQRHLSLFGLSDGGPGATIKAVVLAAYLGSLAIVWTIPELRRQHARRPFITLSAVMFFLLVFYDKVKLHLYFVNIIPFYTAAFALAVSWFWNRKPRVRPILVLVVAAVIGVNGVTILKRFKVNYYRNDYLPVVKYLRAHAPAEALINATAELGFGLGFQEYLDDDQRFGFYSGRTPDIIVLAEITKRDVFPEIKQFEPEVWQHIESVFAQFRPVFANRLYTIYERVPSRLEKAR
jgi:hypothetical protein